MKTKLNFRSRTPPPRLKLWLKTGNNLKFGRKCFLIFIKYKNTREKNITIFYIIKLKILVYFIFNKYLGFSNYFIFNKLEINCYLFLGSIHKLSCF